MDEREAAGIVEREISRLRAHSCEQLRRLEGDVRQVRGERTQTLYSVEVQTFFDDRRTRNLRVLVAVDDGRSLRAVKPLISDFILAPDGTFVGE